MHSLCECSRQRNQVHFAFLTRRCAPLSRAFCWRLHFARRLHHARLMLRLQEARLAGTEITGAEPVVLVVPTVKYARERWRLAQLINSGGQAALAAALQLRLTSLSKGAAQVQCREEWQVAVTSVAHRFMSDGARFNN
jgi:hypothetical protein